MQRRVAIGRWSVVHEMNSRDVVDTGPPFIFASGVLPYEVLLGVAGHLRWRLGDHEVSGDVSPISLAVLFKTHQKSPTVKQPENS